MSAVEGLVGDIGGTNARFALASLEDGRPVLREPRKYLNRDHPSPEAAIEAYLAEVAPAKRPSAVVVAVAGPVADGAIDFTNSDWVLSEAGLRAHGFEAARLVNDFYAQALGVPCLGPGQLRRVGPEVEGEPEASLAVLGPGTGFGVSALAFDDGREAVLASEGGHIAFAPVDELEAEILRWFVRRHGRCSIERILSGPGLFDLYLALAAIEDVRPLYREQREVQAAAEGGDGLARRTVERFCLVLGSSAGDLALAMGARRGVFVTGGVAERLAEQIAAGGFRERFEAKGRFEGYMREIPTFLITERFTALIGAARVLGRMERA